MNTHHKPSAFQLYRRIHPNIDNIGTQLEAVNQDLRNAITYANANEMAMLVDRAISRGASVNYYECYENHLMVVAVRNNQPHAISILMARGLTIPAVPENGIDILMEAAAAGHQELIDPLIDIAGMCIFAVDYCGKTALHHAAIGGSKTIVGMLLEHGALPNVFTSQMDDAELRKLFGNNHNLTGALITPLMIAAAAGNHEIASLLLEAGANPTHGERLPLELACEKGHAPTIKLLLAHQNQPKFTVDDENEILTVSLENGASLECLRLIVAHHCFDEDDGTINTPLGAAIKTQQAPAVALLLAYGAPIEKFSFEKNTLWDEAFAKEKKPWELLDLLVTTSPLKINSPPDYFNENFLINFFDNCFNPIPLAALGFYPSIVVSTQEELKRLQTLTSSCSKMEKQLLTAIHLRSGLQKIPDDQIFSTYDAENNTPEIQWIKTTSIKKQEQKNQLIEAADQFIKAQFNQLKHTLTLEFFLECSHLCPGNRSLKSYILNKLTTELGAPDKVRKSIAQIWGQAAQWTIDWHVAPDAISDANRFIFNLARNLFQKKFTLPVPDDLSTDSLFQTIIVNELSQVSSPLNSFCNNPVTWLRKFEHRSNLRHVNVHDLAVSLQIEFGLPIETCQAISNAWSATINLARKSALWKTPAELDRLLAKALAPRIEQCMYDELAQRIIPDQYLDNLSLWVERVKNQSIRVDGTAVDRKRPASGDPDYAPPRKAARF